MKRRILDMLKKIAFQRLSSAEWDDILGDFKGSPEILSQRARSLLDAVIHHYNYFQVQTIDKFINALLCGCAFKVNLTSNFRIKTNADEYLRYCIDQLIDQCESNSMLANLFRDFLRNFLYLENRSGWFPKEDLISIATTLFHQNNSYGSGFQSSPISLDDIFKTKALDS